MEEQAARDWAAKNSDGQRYPRTLLRAVVARLLGRKSLGFY